MKQLTTKLLALFLFVTLVGLTTSCNDNDDDADPCGSNFDFNEEIQNELNDVISAAQAYSQNPTNANCLAYRDAYLDYLDVIEDLENCARLAGQATAFNQALDEARNALDNLPC